MLHCKYDGMEIYNCGPDDVSTFSLYPATLPHRPKTRGLWFIAFKTGVEY